MRILILRVLVYDVGVTLLVGLLHLLNELRECVDSRLDIFRCERYLHFVCRHRHDGVATFKSRLAHLGFVLLIKWPNVDVEFCQCALCVVWSRLYFDFVYIYGDANVSSLWFVLVNSCEDLCAIEREQVDVTVETCHVVCCFYC